MAIARMEEDEGKWKFLGIMTFLDPPRLDTKETIRLAKAFGVEVSLTTLQRRSFIET